MGRNNGRFCGDSERQKGLKLFCPTGYEDNEMLKWKSYKFGSIANGVESLTDILAGMTGKNRVVKFVTGDIDSAINLRLYRDAEQVVDIECDLITSGAPFLPVDIPLAEGQLLKAGFDNTAAGSVTPTIAIGYEEA